MMQRLFLERLFFSSAGYFNNKNDDFLNTENAINTYWFCLTAFVMLLAESVNYYEPKNTCSYFMDNDQLCFFYRN